MFKKISAALVAALVLFGFFASTTPAMAQTQPKPASVFVGEFGDRAAVQCFALPNDDQGPLCWIYMQMMNAIGFFHANGIGPIVYSPVEAGSEFRDLGVSDDGRYAVVVLDNAVEVLTLERRKPSQPRNRLAGISTPRLKLRLKVEDALSASIGGDNLLVVFRDRLEVYPLVHRVYLPMLHVARQEGPNWARETPVVVDPGSCPRIIRCYGLSSDPPECAERTPEPGELPPTPERGGPVVPTRTPEPVQTEEPIETPIVIP